MQLSHRKRRHSLIPALAALIASSATIAEQDAAEKPGADQPANQPDVVVIQSGAPPPSGDVLDDLLLDHPSACLNGPVAQFGRYVGDWDIAEQSISPDGKTWVKGNGARWKFVCIGGGKAVQDYWIPNHPNGEEFLAGFGSNFRVYDPQKNTWDTVWAGPGGPSFTHMSGQQNAEGNIVMQWVSPVQDPPRRITFFTPTEEGWNWLLELSYDQGQTWQAIYKIKATKRSANKEDQK